MSAADPARRRWIGWVIIALAVGAAYANSFAGAFVYDDLPWIVERTDELSGPVAPALAHTRRPVVTLTLMGNHALGGLDPAGYHVFNLAVHLAAAITLFEIVLGVLRLRGRPDMAAGCALAIAVLWGVHPLQTESVTYVIQRAESMAVLCLFLILLALLRLRAGGSGRCWVTVAIAASLIGMGSKPTMIAAPAVALLFDGLVLSPSFAAALRARWGLHASVVLTTAVLVTTGVVGGVLDVDAERAGAGFGVTTVTSAAYLASQPGVVLHYLQQAFWPTPLCIDWAWPVATSRTAIALASAIVGAMLAVVAWAVVRRHALAFPAIAVVVWLLPTSSVVPLRDLAVEHRMYGPLAGLIAIAVLAAAHAARSRRLAIPAAALAAVLAIALSVLTIRRNAEYASPVTLWESALRVVPDNLRAELNLAIALHDAGHPEEALGRLADVVAARPSHATARYDYGVALLEAGAIEEAIPHLAMAAGALETGRSFAALGTALAAAGRHADAAAAFERAGALDQAIAAYEEALRADPGSDELRVKLERATNRRSGS
jgi:Tfp pilus assembly protein PilF